MQRLQRMGTAWLQSDVWREIVQADAAHAEVPVAQRIPEDGSDTQVRGVIDVVYRTTAGWRLIEVKSHPVDSGDVDAQAEAHAVQVRLYARMWATAVDASVQACLWMADANAWIDVDG
jgi:hypothetical protein